MPAARHEVVEGLRDGVVVFDLQDRLIDANPAAREMLQLANGRSIGLPAAQALAGIEVLELPLRETATRELTIERQGELHYCEVQVQALRDRRGQVSGHLLVLRDIGERKRSEEERVRAQRLRAAGELSLGVSHNLNNILTGILGPAHLLDEIVTEGRAAEYVDIVLHSS